MNRQLKIHQLDVPHIGSMGHKHIYPHFPWKSSIHAGKYVPAPWIPWIHMDPMVWIGLGVQLRSHPRPTTKNYQHNLFFWGGLCQKVKLPKNKLKETTDVAFRCRQVNLPRPMWCFAYMPGQDLQISFLGIRIWWVFADFFCSVCVPYWLGV